jgi:hypothetical protein
LFLSGSRAGLVTDCFSSVLRIKHVSGLLLQDVAFNSWC